MQCLLGTWKLGIWPVVQRLCCAHTTAEAEALAQKFNRQPAVREAAWQQVAFLQVVVWRVLDTEGVRGTGSRVVDMLVEELEGQLIKW